VPEGQTPWAVSPLIVNDGVYPTTVPSHSVDTVGGLAPITLGTPDHPATIHSEIWVRVFDPTSTLATTFRVGPYASPDGLAFVAPGGEDVSFTIAGNDEAPDIVIDVPAAAFDDPTVVRITRREDEPIGIDPGMGLRTAAHFEIDFEGRAETSLVLNVSAPDDAAPEGLVLVGRPTSFPWGRALRILSPGGVVSNDNGVFLTNAEETIPAIPDLTSPDKAGQALDPSTLWVSFTEPGRCAWFYEPASKVFGLGFGTFPATGVSDAYFWADYKEWVYLPPEHNWSGQVALPLPAGERVTVEQRDVATGWLIAGQTFENLEFNDGLVLLEALLPPDPGPPRLVATSHFDLLHFDAPQEDDETTRLRLDIQARAQSEGRVVVELVPGIDPDPSTSIAVYDVVDPTDIEVKQPSSFACAGTASPFAVEPEENLLAVVGPSSLSIDGFAGFSFTYSRQLGVDPEAQEVNPHSLVQIYDLGPVDGCSASPHGGERISFTMEALNDLRTLHIVPDIGLVAGHRYRMEFKHSRIFPDHCGGTEGQQSLCAGPSVFEFATEEQPSGVVGSGGNDGAQVRDLVRVGNLVFTAHLDGTVNVTDTSGGVAGDQGYQHHVSVQHPTANNARAMATDGHGRVFYAARHVVSWTLWAIDVNDVMAAAPGSELLPLPGDTTVCLDITPGDHINQTINALRSMPMGIPSELDLLVSDEESEVMDLDEFCEEFGCTEALEAGPDASGYFDLPVHLTTKGERPTAENPIGSCGSDEQSDRYQRASIDNVATGQTWSTDIPWAGGGSLVQVRVRRGDSLRVRHNLRTLGYMAVMGSGISVFDLNRGYRNGTSGDDWGQTQCGRRLALYQGENLNFDDCGSDGLKQGIPNIPSLAVLAPPGDPLDATQGTDDVQVYSSQMHIGLIHTRSTRKKPADLQHVQTKCLDRSLTLPGPTNSTLSGSWLGDVVVAESVRWTDHGVRSSGPAAGGLVSWEVDQQRHDNPKVVEGDLLFVSIGQNGVLVYDAGSWEIDDQGKRGALRSSRQELELIGHLHQRGHQAFRLQVDTVLNALLTGGYGGVLDVWDLSSINGAPGVDGVVPPQPRMTLRGVPWGTNTLGIDHSGMGLIYAWGSSGEHRNVLSFALNRPKPIVAGVFRAPDDDESSDGGGSDGDEEEPPQREIRPTSMLVPLGVPTELSQTLERDNRDKNEEKFTAAFVVRLALPGFVGPEVTVSIDTLNVKPPEHLLGLEDLEFARAAPPGKGWPEHLTTDITLKRIGGTDASVNGRFGSSYNLYESDDIVLLVSDPRAVDAYEPQGAPGDDSGDELPDIHSEAGQCRRCERPEFLTESDEITELFAGGPFVRVRLNVEDDPTLRSIYPDDARVPAGVIELAGWADDIPSPSQVSLVEPVVEPAEWSHGGAFSVSLVTGEATFVAIDHEVAGRALGFSLTRAHRSDVATYNPLGRAGWTSAYFSHLRENPITGEVEYHDGSGRVWRFFPMKPSKGQTMPGGDSDGDFWSRKQAYDLADRSYGESDEYYCPKNLPLTLRRAKGVGWRLYGLHNDSLIFNHDGQLIEIADRLRQNSTQDNPQGNRIRLFRDGFGRLSRVEDDFGRDYWFRYAETTDPEDPEFGLLKEVEDYAGRVVAYEYETADGNRRLDRVQLPTVTGSVEEGSVTPAIEYTYDADDYGEKSVLHGDLSGTRLKSYRLPRRTRETETITRQNTDGRVVSVASPQSTTPWSLVWQTNSSTNAVEQVDVTSPLGTTSTYHLYPASGTWPGKLHRVEVPNVEVLDTGIASPDVPDGGGSPGLPTRTLTASYIYHENGQPEFFLQPDGTKIQFEWRDGDRLARQTLAKKVTHYNTAPAGGHDYESVTQEFNYGEADRMPSGYTMAGGLDLSIDPRVVALPLLKINPGTAIVPTVLSISAGFWDPDKRLATTEKSQAQFDFRTKVAYNEHGQTTLNVRGVDATDTGVLAEQVAHIYSSTMPAGVVGAGYLEKTLTGRTNQYTTTYTYDEFGNVSKVEASDAGAVLYYQEVTNDEWGRPYKVISGKGDRYQSAEHEVKTTYDASGRVVKEEWTQAGPGTVSVTYTYDDRDRLEKVISTGLAGAESGTWVTGEEVYEYDDSTGQLVSVTSPGGVRETYEYDAVGNVSKAHITGSGPRYFAYDAMGRQVWSTDGDDGAWRGEYDAWGRLFKETYPDGTRLERSFDVAGAVTDEKIFDSSGGTEPISWVEQRATPLGTPWQVQQRIGPQPEPDDDGNQPSAPFVRMVNRFDTAGRVTSTVVDDGAGTVAPLESTTEFLLDGSGRVLSETDPFGNQTVYTYTGGEQLPSTITTVEAAASPYNPISTSVALAYDAQGRVIRSARSEDQMTLVVEYDQVGNVISQALTGAFPQKTTWMHDAAGRVVEVSSSGGQKTTYGYDKDGRRTKETVSREGASDTSTWSYDASGRLERRRIAGREEELFVYNSDDTVESWTTAFVDSQGGGQLTLEYRYDDLGRPIRRYVANPGVFIAPSFGLAPMDQDVGDAWVYDQLGRVVSVDKIVERADPNDPGLDRIDTSSSITITYPAHDPRDLPASEFSGHLTGPFGSPAVVVRGFDAHGFPQSWQGPLGIGSHSATSDELQRRSAIAFTGDHSGGPVATTYPWGGTGRPLGLTVGSQTRSIDYSGPGSRLGALGLSIAGAPLGSVSFGWDAASNLKSTRINTAGGLDLDVFGGSDWAWRHRDGARLRDASSSIGDFRFDYGVGDGLKFVDRDGDLARFQAAGAQGRPLSFTNDDGDESLGHDALGRRIEDGRHRYTWSWRGELVRVEVVDPESDLLGHAVDYRYTAAGSLARRTHVNPEGDFVDGQLFVWNGQELIAQLGVNHQDDILWTAEYVPGPVGLDDSPLVRVTENPGSGQASVRDLHLLRDEMGSVIGIVDAHGVSLGDVIPLRARVLYSPYGQPFLEMGPQLVSIEHDVERVSLGDVDQSEVPLEPPVDDPEGELEPTAMPGALIYEFSIALAPETLDGSVGVWLWSDDFDDWIDVTHQHEIALDEDRPSRLVIMPLEPWARSSRLSVVLSNNLKDGFARAAVFPGQVAEFEVGLPIPESVPFPYESLEGFPVEYPLDFDAVTAASARLDCTPRSDDEPQAHEFCFPNGLNTLFQGLWHDPTTGLAYARARWYDSRTAHWLSPDPMGAFDSPNQYAFVAWGPERFVDPSGEVAIAIPLLAIAAYAIWEAGEEIERAVDADPYANMGLAGAKGAGRAVAIGGVAWATAGGATAAAGAMGLGTTATLALGGAAGGFGTTLGADIYDVGLFGDRSWSTPGKYAVSTGLGAVFGVAARGVGAVLGRVAARNPQVAAALQRPVLVGSTSSRRHANGLWYRNGRELSTKWKNVRPRMNRAYHGHRSSPRVQDPQLGRLVPAERHHGVLAHRHTQWLANRLYRISPRAARSLERFSHSQTKLMAPSRHAMADRHVRGYDVPLLYRGKLNPLRTWEGLAPWQRVWGTGAVAATGYGSYQLGLVGNRYIFGE
jgi:RHS repeat-associated protein